MNNSSLISANDLIDNPSPRCPCVLVLDTSSSMNGEPISQLNAGVQHFIQALNDDEVAACSVEVAVITAGSSVSKQLPFTSAMSIESIQSFSANGMTPLGGAVDMALNLLEERKQEYQNSGVAYFQPWLVMISDGAPNDSWQVAAARAKQMSEQSKLVSLVVGVDGADMGTLGMFSNRPALKLDGLKFHEFFEWLSASMSRVSNSASTTSTVNLPPMDSWASI
ncbi:MAG: VWA domain-containing protein [Gammaproteobacteria bacterium]|nr:VWA domain-containing protein [Gammaproteobacteria bacterium]